MKLLKVSAVAMIVFLSGCEKDQYQGNNASSGYVGHSSSRPVSVPEPGSLLLTGLGIAALGAFWRKGKTHVSQEHGDPTRRSRRVRK
jgi:PEP-CTERM motif